MRFFPLHRSAKHIQGDSNSIDEDHMLYGQGQKLGASGDTRLG